MPSPRHLVTYWLALAGMSLLLMGSLTYQRIDRQMEDAAIVAQTEGNLAELNRLLLMTVEAESNQRGFLISGDERYLPAFEENASQVEGLLRSLQTRFAEKPEQQRNLAEFARQYQRQVEDLRRGIAARRAKGFAAAQAIAVAGEGRAATDEVHLAVTRMRNREGELLDARTDSTSQSMVIGQVMVIASSAIALFSIVFAGYQMSSEWRRRRHAEMELQDTLASVEHQVAERTDALSSAMAELKLSEQQFRLITDLSPVHLFRAGAEGQAKYFSPGFGAMTGMPLEDALGLGWIEAVHPDDRERLMHGWQEALRSQTVFQAEFRFRTVAGEFRWYRSRMVPDRDEQGAVTGWVGAAVDLHELHLALDERAAALSKAEDARRVAEEASQLKDEFLATASHELRTPLNAIVGWVHVLRTGALESDEQRKHALEAVDRNAKIQTRLIEDLLDVSRMIQGRMSLTVAPMDLRQVVHAAVDTIKPGASAKEMVLEVDTPPAPISVIGDDQRLQQVVWNLLSNAVKYTPRGGRIKVSASVDDRRGVVRVNDSGEGIDPAFLPYVFEPFRQGSSATMRKGLGLGLAIVRRLVDLHGGRITVESSGTGNGSEFIVSLPLAHTAALAAPPGRTERMFDQLHVLVAEDDADSAAAVTAILQLHGCETRTASTASECLNISGRWTTDVLVCDLGLPDDDGYSLLRRLRNLPGGGSIPAIALTAYARPEDRDRALAAGFRAHLSKPFDPESLLRELSSAVKGRSNAAHPT
jgi:PAS domain S-box-containing protein